MTAAARLVLVRHIPDRIAAQQARGAQEAVMDLGRRLREAGWQVNVAFESGDDGERFTLSGVQA